MKQKPTETILTMRPAARARRPWGVLGLLFVIGFGALLAGEGSGQDQALSGRYTYRFLGFIKLFSISLYWETDDAAQARFDGRPYALRFDYYRGFSAEQLVAEGNKALAKEASEQEMARFAESLDRINASYLDVSKGDRYRLDIIPDERLTLSFNGKELIAISQPGFGEFYTRIWLGEREECQAIKNALLPERLSEASQG
ncbi:chalcone isomerase family protein [Pelagicoccus sp. SDUM812003]|uniref:chalcone isomerase family protein n=1 Tax=Pelagicoccus sp. SDUM812003 TaxID=3041267 RepID=UPI00280D24E3|nr:chalcone isomerase family protein [Pelagicoccus sp. SDUM812003]MDQ8204148.1 chalcone isomerase family protein [Pelagicoccus sp. SDUM812003]